MRNLIVYLFLIGAAAQRNAHLLNVTIFYETLCDDSVMFFKEQLEPAFKIELVNKHVYFELVPFGKAAYKTNPWEITCQHGPEECAGNAQHACFYARHPDNKEQVNFGLCTMSDSNPPQVGKQCAEKLKYSYEGVEKCSVDEEGQQLTIKYGRRTLLFTPKITFIPSIAFNDVFKKKDQENSMTNFTNVVLTKLNSTAMAIKWKTKIRIACE